MITKIYVTCPLDGSSHQQYCSLVDTYKENGVTNECLYRSECTQQIKPIDNMEKLDETLAKTS